MPLPEIEGVFRVALDWEESGTHQTAANVMHVRGEFGSSAAEDAAAAIHTALDANQALMFATVKDTAELQSISVTPLDGSSATFIEPVDDVTGANGGTQFEPALAPVITLYTNTRGRSGRGRVYLPFTTEDTVNSGTINGTQLAQLETGWEAFVSQLEDAPIELPLVVASYLHSDSHDVTSIAVNAVFGTQRRRQSRLR